MRQAWKAIALGLVNLVAVLAVLVLLQPLTQTWPSFGSAVVSAALCLAAYVAASKWIERRAPTELAPQHALPELSVGLVGGFALFSILMAVLWLVGAYHPQGWSTAVDFGPGIALALLGGIVEEILFRGLLFRLSARILGTWGALLLTSALFGVAHAANHGATVGSSLAVALEAGVLLGLAYAATGRLWLPIGLHTGWNFTEGSIFGTALSGHNLGSGLVRGTLVGPVVLTGGEFGPEGSLIAVVVCLAASACLLWRVLALRRAEPPIWRRPAARAGGLAADQPLD